MALDGYRHPKGWSVGSTYRATGSRRWRRIGASSRGSLRKEFTTLYASEFAPDVRQVRIVPALLWYGGLGMNRVRLEDPDLFDLRGLQVSLA